MADAAQPKKGGWLKAMVVGVVGLGSGAVATYTSAVVTKIAHPALPVANFAVTADGLNATIQNHATGDNGWWDFGDGSPLEPFDPAAPAVTHAYAKPGNYGIKLTVRNFVADENDRTVTVDVAAGAQSAAANPPQITGFTVQAVSPVSVAPATYRVTAEVKDAERCVWDFGENRLEVADAGKIDRLVTFEKPGTFSVQLVAHNAKTATKQSAPVKVDAPVAGTLMAVLKVTNVGTKVDRVTRAETVAVAAPKEKASPAFAKAVHARPGFTLVNATPANPNPPGVKNLKVEVAADKKSAKVSGERGGDAKGGKGSGSDLLVPLKLTEERTTTLQLPAETITGVFTQSAGGQTALTLPLPHLPPGVTSSQRKMSLEVRQAAATGPSKVMMTAPELKMPWTGGKLDFGVRPGGTDRLVYPVRAEQKGDTVVLVIGA